MSLFYNACSCVVEYNTGCISCRLSSMYTAIREEIREIEEGKYDKDNNVLKVRW